ncbi:MAG: sulfatase-like hydrolase/transferase, partial [Roseimicrobium sp.]
MKPLLLLALAFLLTGPLLAAEAKRPNILFIIFDDWNGSTHAGAYGCDWVKTPNFDRIAREGVLFKNAFTSNP